MNVMVKNRERREKLQSEWYSLRPILGFANWALIYILLGGREAGKSYSVTDYVVHSFVEKGIPFFWIRLTEKQSNKLLQNNAEKLVDPDIRRRYALDLVTSGNNVYSVKRESYVVHHKDGTEETKWRIVEKKLMARVYALSTFYTDKGSIFDKDFLNDPKMQYHVAIDEFQREKGEKNTFDILYALVNQLENLLRSTKERTKIFFMGNTLEEASDVLCAFNFIPEEFGRYKLKKKRAVIEYIEPSEAYLKRRKGTLADILMPTASTFTNKIDTDKTLISKKRPKRVTRIIKFTKRKETWFTVWDGNLIKKHGGEAGDKNNKGKVTAMRPYLDELYDRDLMMSVVTLFNTRSYVFSNLITFKSFQKEMELLIPQR